MGLSEMFYEKVLLGSFLQAVIDFFVDFLTLRYEELSHAALIALPTLFADIEEYSQENILQVSKGTLPQLYTHRYAGKIIGQCLSPLVPIGTGDLSG